MYKRGIPRAGIKFCSIVKLTAGHSKVENLHDGVTSAASDKTFSTECNDRIDCGRDIDKINEGGHILGG